MSTPGSSTTTSTSTTTTSQSTVSTTSTSTTSTPTETTTSPPPPVSPPAGPPSNSPPPPPPPPQNSSSTSSTTSSTSSTSTTSTPQSTTSTSSSSSEASLTTTQVSTDAGGQLTTVTVVVPASTTSRAIPSPTGVSNGSNNSFFDNKGAVGGTFAAVGIVALVIGIFIVTSIIRKRRARKWDDEVSAAATEAANHRMPVFLDDPEEKPFPPNDRGYNPNAAGPSGYGVGNYSDVSSHGTYAQSAMGHESQYPEMSTHGPGPGGIYDYNAAYATGPVVGAGAAGIGVARTRSRGAGANLRDTPATAIPDHGAGMNDGYAAGLGEGGSPYPAFLAPGQGYEAYNNALNQGYQEDRSNAGTPGTPSGTTRANAMASVAAAAAAGGSRPSASPPAGVGRSSNSNESYASHYTPSGSPARPDAGRPSVEKEPSQPRSQEGLPNPFSSRIESEDESDGEEDVPGRRVLKVANE